MIKHTTITILFSITFLNSSLEIYVPDEEVNQKPITYTSGIKTSDYHRPFQLQVNHNYSKVYHHNPPIYTPNFSGEEETTQQRPYPVYNAHTYASRPNARLTQVYVLNGSRIGTNPNPLRQVVTYNKQKRTPKIQVYRACPKNATGQYVYESSCNQFLNCWKGRGYVQNCAPGTLFNPKTLECDLPDKVYCISGPRRGVLQSERSTRNLKQIGCPKDFSGLIPNYTDCSKFINCVSGIENFMDCPVGTLFDINKNICDFAHKATCFNGENQKLIQHNIDGKLDFYTAATTQPSYQLRYLYSEPKCPHGVDGLYKHPTDCSKYLNCANGQTYVQTCSPGTLFNPEVKICDFPYNVICRNGTESGINIVDYDAGYYQRNKSGGYYGNSNVFSGSVAHENVDSEDRYNRGQHIGQSRPYFYGTSSYDRSGSKVYGNYSQEQTQYNRGYNTHGSNYGSSSNQYGHSGNNGYNIYGMGSYGDSSTNRYRDNDYTRPSTDSTFNSGYDSHSNRRIEDQYQGYGNSENQYHYNQDPQHGLHTYNSNTYRPNENGRETYHGIKNPYSSVQNGQGQHRYTNVAIGSQQPSSYSNPSYQNQNHDGWSQDPYDNNGQNRGFFVTRPANWNQNQNSRVDSHYGTSQHNSNQNSRVDNGYNPSSYNPSRPDNNYDQNYLGATTVHYDNPDTYNQRPMETNSQRTNLAGSYATYTKTYYDNNKKNWNLEGSHSRPNNQHTNNYNSDRMFTSYNQGNGMEPGTSYGQTVTPGRTNEFQHGQRGETGYNQWYGHQNRHRDDHIPQGHRNVWTQQATNDLDDEGITSNYDQVVNINQVRRTTSVPFRNSYEPFYGSTSLRPRVTSSGRSNDYDDTFVPGYSRKYIRSTTPKMLEKSWPPPFPSTDVNADYVFEYDDNEGVLEAENSVKNDGQRNSECGKSHFVCANQKCISKALVCNGNKDCPNGKDEEKCLDYVSRFSIKKNQKLAILEKERWDNVSIAACALMCVETQKLRCKSFNYRKIDKTCFLTDTNEGLSGALISYYPFDYYELISDKINCSNMFVCSNKKCIDKKKICDGFDDCGDRMDEKGCNAKNFGYSIRLTGSRNKNEGSIEVTAFGKTGYVCDDKFGLRDANVVCKELGFYLGAAEVKGNSFFVKEFKSNPFYMMDDISCLGNETKLLDCDFSGWGVHNCLGQEVAGVVCKTPSEKCASDYWQCDTGQECLPLAFVCDGLLDCTDGSDEGSQHCDAPTEIRLVNGTNQREGRVEIKHHGIWGTVCDDDFNEDAAKVVCRQLGFKGASLVKKDAHFGSGVGPVWLDQVFCAGNETSIENCSHWNWGEHNCEHSEDVGVICSNSYEYVERHSFALPSRRIQTYPERCGYRKDNIFNRNDDVHFRVVKGSIAKMGDYPWQAAIRVKGKTTTTHWCGAVIISQKFVLTAAHCLIGYSKGAYVIVAGDYNVDEDEGSEQEARIEDFYLHEHFREGHKMNNDIALVKLKGRGFQLNDDVQAICLPDVDTKYDNELNCTISGFGSVESGKSAFSHNLRAGWVPLQKREICTMPHVYGNALTDGMICAGSLDEGIDSCDGDSGGPLACLNGGVFTLYGITSWGQHCGYANKPGVYVKVAHYRKWIDDNLRKYSTK